jgi:hypothetical protein
MRQAEALRRLAGFNAGAGLIVHSLFKDRLLIDLALQGLGSSIGTRLINISTRAEVGTGATD